MADVVRFRMPTGDEITVKLIDHPSGVTFEPISKNARHVHHHSFEDKEGNWNILIRDENNQNIAAYVLDKRTGHWKSRLLTPSEKKARH